MRTIKRVFKRMMIKIIRPIKRRIRSSMSKFKKASISKLVRPNKLLHSRETFLRSITLIKDSSAKQPSHAMRKIRGLPKSSKKHTLGRLISVSMEALREL